MEQATSDLLRDHFVSSWMIDVHASISEIALVAAANSTSTKNTMPMMVAAPPMSWNTPGSVMKMSDGPAFMVPPSPRPSAM